MRITMLKEFLQLAQIAFDAGNTALGMFYHAKAEALTAAV